MPDGAGSGCQLAMLLRPSSSDPVPRHFGLLWPVLSANLMSGEQHWLIGYRISGPRWCRVRQRACDAARALVCRSCSIRPRATLAIAFCKSDMRSVALAPWPQDCSCRAVQDLAFSWQCCPRCCPHILFHQALPSFGQLPQTSCSSLTLLLGTSGFNGGVHRPTCAALR